MKTCSLSLDIIQITPSTTFYPNKLNVAIVYGPGLITLNFLVRMMTEILLIGCFLRHTIQFNVLCVNVSSLNVCFVLIAFCPFLHCQFDALCHHFNKAFMYMYVYVVTINLRCPKITFCN